MVSKYIQKRLANTRINEQIYKFMSLNNLKVRQTKRSKDIENKNTQLPSSKTAKAHHNFRNLKINA